MSFAKSRKETLKIFSGFFSSRFPRNIQKTALRKLTLIHGAASLDFLRIPPANRLQKLGGDRKGQWSIRINEQYSNINLTLTGSLALVI